MIRRKTKKSIVDWVLFVLLLVGALATCGPFAWTLATSFKPDAEVFTYPPQLISSNPQPGNYVDLFLTLPMARAIFNSLVVVTSITILQVIVCSMAAYAFSFLRFRGREALFVVFLMALMVPPQVTLIPNFIMVRNFGWIDTYRGLILPFAFSSFGVFLLRQYFLTIASELIEAAKLDGCKHWKIYLFVVLPLARPALGALAIFAFVSQWNNFLWPLITTTSPEMQTVVVALSSLRGQFSTDWPLLMAGSIVAVGPVLIVFILGNRSFISGLTAGSFGGR